MTNASTRKNAFLIFNYFALPDCRDALESVTDGAVVEVDVPTFYLLAPKTPAWHQFALFRKVKTEQVQPALFGREHTWKPW